MKNTADKSDIVPIMKKGNNEASGLIARTSTVMPFRIKAATKAPKPKFRGVFFAQRKERPANRLMIPKSVQAAFRNQSGVLNMPLS